MSNRNFKRHSEFLEKRKMMELKKCDKKQKKLDFENLSKLLKIDNDFLKKHKDVLNKKT